jgi:hypothetical protein
MPKKPKKPNIIPADWLDDSVDNFGFGDMPDGLDTAFWAQMAAFEDNTRWMVMFEVLEQGGLALPHPDELDATQLAPKLWEVIRGLAMLRTFLYHTDHLSDRGLYEKLWHEVLREAGPLLPSTSDMACHIDLVGSETDTELYLRYYADEESRRDWLEDWPDEAMPEHEPLPFDRDRHLPSRDQAEWNQVGKPS